MRVSISRRMPLMHATIQDIWHVNCMSDHSRSRVFDIARVTVQGRWAALVRFSFALPSATVSAMVPRPVAHRPRLEHSDLLPR